jgi:hypothetical protein
VGCYTYLLDGDLEENRYLINFSHVMSSVISTNGNDSHVLHEMIMQLIYYGSKFKLMKNAPNEHIVMVKVIP